MAVRTKPEQGDVVVREDKRKRRRVYILHTAPGAEQYLLHSREEAVAQAVTFAKHQHVRVWLTEGGCDFTLLEDFRVAESV